jgi:hypothetical protein
MVIYGLLGVERMQAADVRRPKAAAGSVICAYYQRTEG